MEQATLEQFEGQTYLNLETCRKNGQAVATPVWFIRDGIRLLVNTQAGSGKIKRIRNCPDVRVMPCTVSGGSKGEWVPARAIIGTEVDSKTADMLLTQKYGLQKHIFKLLGKLTRAKYVVIVIN